jgi:hypothetical protein
MTHHNQTKELTLGFSISPLMSPLTTKAQSLKFESKRPHEAQLEDQKAKKSSRRSSRRGKPAKANNRQKKRQRQAK